VRNSSSGRLNAAHLDLLSLAPENKTVRSAHVSRGRVTVLRRTVQAILTTYGECSSRVYPWVARIRLGQARSSLSCQHAACFASVETGRRRKGEWNLVTRKRTLTDRTAGVSRLDRHGPEQATPPKRAADTSGPRAYT
jgi:hypothetical protein